MALLTAALTVAAVGCAAPRGATEEPTSSAAEIAIGGLAAGRYTNSEFTPRIEVQVPAGWLTYHLSPDFFDVASETPDGPVVVMFLRPTAFLTPSEAVEAATPEEAIAILDEHPGVSASTPRPIEVDGMEGLEVVAEFAIDDTHVMRVEQGDIGFGPQTSLRLAYLVTDAGVLVIGLNAPAGQLEEAERLSEGVWASIRIGD